MELTGALRFKVLGMAGSCGWQGAFGGASGGLAEGFWSMGGLRGIMGG